MNPTFEDLTSYQKKKINKMVAINTLNANRNLMSQLGDNGSKNRVLWLTLKRECNEILKRFPSLR